MLCCELIENELCGRRAGGEVTFSQEKTVGLKLVLHGSNSVSGERAERFDSQATRREGGRS